MTNDLHQRCIEAMAEASHKIPNEADREAAMSAILDALLPIIAQGLEDTMKPSTLWDEEAQLGFKEATRLAADFVRSIQR